MTHNTQIPEYSQRAKNIAFALAIATSKGGVIDSKVIALIDRYLLGTISSKDFSTAIKHYTLHPYEK